MNEWTKEQLEEMFGDDVIEKLAFLAGCTKHRLANDPEIPDGWIVTMDRVPKNGAPVFFCPCAQNQIAIQSLKDRPEDIPGWKTMMNLAQVTCKLQIAEHFGVDL